MAVLDGGMMVGSFRFMRVVELSPCFDVFFVLFSRFIQFLSVEKFFAGTKIQETWEIIFAKNSLPVWIANRKRIPAVR